MSKTESPLNSLSSSISSQMPKFMVLVSELDDLKIKSLIGDIGICTITYTTIKNSAIQFDQDGTIISYEILGILLGSVTLTAESRAILNEQKPKLDILGSIFGNELFDLSRYADDDQKNLLLGWISKRLANLFRTVLNDSAHVRAGLATLRQEHDEAMERFQQLEWSISRAGTPKRILRLNYTAKTSYVSLGGDATVYSQVARQYLPTRCSGLSCIDLFPQNAIEEEGVCLRIALFEGGNQVASKVWELTSAELKFSPIALYMDEALVSRERDSTVEISWVGSSIGSVSFALGQTTALNEYCAIQTNGTQLTAPIAVRLWEMPPGSVVVQPEMGSATEIKALSVTPNRLLQRLRLPFSQKDLEAVEHLAPKNIDLGFKIVGFRSETCDVIVHPVDGQTVYAILRNINYKNIYKLSALVQIANKESNAVEFGLAAVPGNQTNHNLENLIRNWTKVEPDHLTEISGTICDTQEQQVDVILATRMHQGNSANLAWALFKRIEIVV